MILILGAMNEEIAVFKKAMTNKEEKQWQNFKVYEGKLHGFNVVLAKTGVGKTLSAMLTQALIDRYSPEMVLMTGIAGGLNESLGIGDVVIGRDSIQHDMDVTALGIKRGEIPYSGIRIVKGDQDLLAKASTYTEEGVNILPGRVLTGDQFVTWAFKDTHDYLKSELFGDAIEMEGASVGTVCHVNGIPHLLIRVISDMADGKAPRNFNEFLDQAGHRTYSVVAHLLSQIK